ncbi:hypothetical protein [Rubellimicrobium rubrum]|uniref:hypothetical protein n=1 Tax=Rubellimicrobium rubrum TaxID=2585369 RepID=UPI001FE8C9A7|nr:hypothetical protein [Rubellimicrobium rubrum]
MLNDIARLARNKFLWVSTFDDECRHRSFFQHAARLLGSRPVEEKQAYWRQHGRERFTPEDAALRARDEIADELLRAARTNERVRDGLGEVAHSIALEAPTRDRLKESFRSLSEEWWSIYLDHTEKQNARFAFYREIASQKFSRDELASAWGRLLEPKMPEAVLRLWEASRERRHVADLAASMGVSAKEMALWMRVLSDHDLGSGPCLTFQGFQRRLCLPSKSSEEVRRVGERLGLS